MINQSQFETARFLVIEGMQSLCVDSSVVTLATANLLKRSEVPDENNLLKEITRMEEEQPLVINAHEEAYKALKNQSQ